MNRLSSILAVLTLLVSTASCATDLSARAVPDANLGKDLSYFVVKQPKDNGGINVSICEQLNDWGRSTTTGTAEGVPEELNVLVTYEDKWYWDINMYLLSLDISFRDPTTEEEIAGGYSMATSFVRRNGGEHARLILPEVFAKTNPEETPPVKEGK